MLDGLLGRGFTSKCKSLIKATRTRIDVVRRRKEATQRFLKGNLAQLLSNGLDINAFGRTEEFLAGLNLLACYDFLEQCCEHILKKLSLMQKQSECPEECREAVGSLMFAAARFSDMPELRDLRDALQERYESSLEHFVNQEFFERLAMKPPTKEKKIQLLEDISSELSIKWDSRGFQKRMLANPSLPAQNQVKKQELTPNRVTSLNLRKDNEVSVNSNKRDQLVRGKSDLSSDGHKAKNGGVNPLMRQDEVVHPPAGVGSADNWGKPYMGNEHKTAERDHFDMTPRGRRAKGELSTDEIQTKYIGENSLMRKEDLNNLSVGQARSTATSGKSSMGSEHNTHGRKNYNATLGARLEEGDHSSDDLRATNGRENYLKRKDKLDILFFERGDPMSNSHKPSTHSEKNTPRRENYAAIPVGPEQGEFSMDGSRAKSGRDNYKSKQELDHLSLGQGDLIGYSQKLHIGSEGRTPHCRREETANKNDPTAQIYGKEDNDHRRNGHGSSSRGKRSGFIDEQDTPQKEIYGVTAHPRQDFTDGKNKSTLTNGKDEIVHRRERHGSSSNKLELEYTVSTYEVENKHEGLSIIRDGKNVSSDKHRNYKEPSAAISYKLTQREDTELLKPNSSYALPPPYVKSNNKLVPPPYVKTIEAQKMSSNHDGTSVDPGTRKRDDVDGRSERVLHEDKNYEDMGIYGREKDVPFRDHVPLPRPRSIRKKHLKASSNRDAPGDSEDLEVIKRNSSSRRRDHHSKKGLQILFEDEHKQKDDEDRKLDKLLLHYSKKPSTYDEEKVRRKMKSHVPEAPNNDFNEGEASGFPTRSISLPREFPSQEQVKVYARANSFQPDKPAGHVHPKLPNYDDLAAQFAALKGR